MKIKAAETLRGELVLASIGRTLTKGQTIAINENAYWNTDIQTMIRYRRISIVEGEDMIPQPDPDTTEQVTVQCLHPRSLVLPTLRNVTLKQGQIHTMSRREFERLDIQQAIAGRLIVEVETPEYMPDVIPEEKAIISESDPQLAASKKRTPSKPEDLIVDLTPEDDSEKFKRTGQARVIERAEKPRVPKNMFVYDPHGTLNEPSRTPEGMHAYDPHKAAREADARAAVAERAAKAKAAAAQTDDSGDPPLTRNGSGSKRVRTAGESRRAIRPSGRARQPGERGSQGGYEDDGGDSGDGPISIEL